MDCDYAPFKTLFTKFRGDSASLNTSITTGDISGATTGLNTVFGGALEMVDKWKEINTAYKPLQSSDSFIKNFIAEETADKVGNIMPDLQHQYSILSTSTSLENKKTVAMAFIAGVLLLNMIILWLLSMFGIGKGVRMSIMFVMVLIAFGGGWMFYTNV
jgi:hypothetical protein